MPPNRCDVLVVGGGPAGLRVAELTSAAGLTTVLADHKPSVGRKLLVAGRGGLNLTHSEAADKFPARYGDDTVSQERWKKLLTGFSPGDLRAWVHDLGVETFVGTSGRVFPVNKQAAPLLRRWVERLRRQGVSFRPRHGLKALAASEGGSWDVTMAHGDGDITIHTEAVALALGGASWPQTGSDGVETQRLTEMGIEIKPFAPANCGYEIQWPARFLMAAEGFPLKNIRVRANGDWISGELLITRYGLEGGALYQLGRELRRAPRPEILVDLKPAFTVEQLLLRVTDRGNAAPSIEHAGRAWKLSPAAQALLQYGFPPATTWTDLAQRVKGCPLVLGEARPLAEAISSAGGVSWSELDDDLMVKRHPGLFCAGEMIDWETPTGGYLLQGCLSTATCAARGLLRYLDA